MVSDAVNVTHKKTGRTYKVLQENIVNATNGFETQEMVLYTNGDLTFVREQKEFWQKFEKEKNEN
jgi:hypothetical protein